MDPNKEWFYKKLVFLLLIYMVSVFSLNISVQKSETLSFPNDFVDDWIGGLLIYNANGLQQSVAMELIIQPIDSTDYSWSLIYGEDKIAGLRAFELILLDKEKGHFEIVVGPYKSFRTTGGTTVNEEEIPAVQSFNIIGRHKAVLSKKA